MQDSSPRHPFYTLQICPIAQKAVEQGRVTQGGTAFWEGSHSPRGLCHLLISDTSFKLLFQAASSRKYLPIQAGQEGGAFNADLC